ncbi:hypothetical protein GCM10010269_67720 [Streptomyces humidus]|uniref:Autoinducer 2 import system permease protein LsrC n=1 Tax=Streptomyces humidus TaxID=52259 RepID=A0A918G5E8_9ACTN|nr:hypothetical protein GCM10010269_67720 [Streptomyces humidus]
MVRLRTSAFVTTLAMATLLGGVVQWATDGQQITPSRPTGLSELSAQRFAGLNLVTYPVAVVLLIFWWLLGHTPYGRRLYAVGSNSRAAMLIGIRADRLVFSAFAVSGLIAGLTGSLYLARMGGSAADGGAGMMFPALAAVFLGASAVQPGRYNIAGTVLGLLFVAACVSGLTLSGVAAWVEPVFNGAALTVAVCMAALLTRRRTGPSAL